MSDTTRPATITYDANGDARSFVGREAVEVMRLAAFIVAIRAEARTPGLRLTRGPKAITRARRQLGLKGNAQAIVAQLEAMLDAQKEKVEHVTDTHPR